MIDNKQTTYVFICPAIFNNHTLFCLCHVIEREPISTALSEELTCNRKKTIKRIERNESPIVGLLRGKLSEALKEISERVEFMLKNDDTERPQNRLNSLKKNMLISSELLKR